MDKLSKWVMLQKEGFIVGLLWGVISIFAIVGMASIKNLTVFHKFLVLPAIISNYFPVRPEVKLILTIFFGVIIGVFIDSIYKPRS